MTEPLAYPFNDPRSLAVSGRYELLRASGKLTRVRLSRGEPAWLVVSHADARFVLGDPRFSRAAAKGRDVPRQSHSPLDAGLLALDAPEHTRLRSFISRAFTMRRSENQRPHVRNLAMDLATALRGHGPPADLVDEYALPLTTGVICALLGVPEEDHARFRSWSDTRLSTTTLPPDEVARGSAELRAYIAELVAAKRRRPDDDLLTELLAESEEGDRLSPEELVDLAITLLFAGYEATATQIPNFTYFLMRHPWLWDELRRCPERVPAAVEELLRYVPVMAGAGTMPRYALEDVQVGGTLVAAGEPVIVSLGASNRDDAVFPDPGVFDVRRERSRHLAFGHGPHHCVGMSLARVELQEALSALLAVFPALVLADDVTWKEHVMRGPGRMPVTW